MEKEVYVAMPLKLTGELIDVVRNDPLCSHDDKDEMNKRIGWLYCAYDAMIKHQTKPE